MRMLKRKRLNQSSSRSAFFEPLETRVLMSVQTVAAYNFNALGTGGTTVADISNDGFTVQYPSAQTLSTDNPFGEANNNSISVTGATGAIANHSTLNLNNGSNTFTIEGWIKPSSTSIDYIAQLTNTSNNPIISLGTYTGGVAYARFRAGGTEYALQTGTVVIGGWNYMALVYDGSAMHLYLKNSHYTSLTDVGDKTVGATLPTGFGTSANIASEPTAGSANTALFDDIRLSSTAATTAELGYHASFGAAAPAGYLDASTYFLGGLNGTTPSPGWNATDATLALQYALDTGRNVWVPKEASSWILGSLNASEQPSTSGDAITFRNNNQELQFDSGVVVGAKSGVFLGTTDNLFQIKNVSGVTVEGNGATMTMNQADYTKAPYAFSNSRTGIQVYGGSNLTIEDLHISNTGGDAISIAKGAGTSQNVLINDIFGNNNYRNGISVISANGLTITNSQFENNNGTAPKAGIDIEPNSGEPDQLTNISITNCIFANNAFAQISVSLAGVTSTTPPISISFDNDQVLASTTGSGSTGIWVQNIAPGTTGSVMFTNMTVDMATGANSIKVRDKSATGARVSFGDPSTGVGFGTIEARGSNAPAGTYPIQFFDDGVFSYGTFGGIDMYQVDFGPAFTTSAGYFLHGIDDTGTGTGTAITDLQASFYFQDPANATYHLTTPQTNVNVTIGALGGATTIAQYDFDSLTLVGTQDTTPDNSGNGYNLTYNHNYETLISNTNPFGNQSGDNSVQAKNDIGKAANFANIDLATTNAFTIEGWIDPSVSGSVNKLVEMQDGGQYITLEMNTNGTVYSRITSGTTYAISSTDTLVNGAWNYLALTYNGSTLSLYILNSNHPTLTLVGTATPNVTLPSTLTYMYVATAGSTNTVLYDDIRISNAVLSDAQLGYHGSFTGPASQLRRSTTPPVKTLSAATVSPAMTAAPAGGITAAPANLSTADFSSALIPSTGYAKHEPSGGATADLRKSFYFLAPSGVAYTAGQSQGNANTPTGQLWGQSLVSEPATLEAGLYFKRFI